MSFTGLNLPSTRFTSDRSKWPRKGYERSKFGQRVLWHDVSDGGRHLSPTALEPYRHEGDEEVDHIIDLLEREGRPLGAGDDLLSQASTASAKDRSSTSSSPACLTPSERALADFYQRYSLIPSWVDIDELKRGQEVFLAYVAGISLSLYYRSLVPGFSIPKIAAVLRETGYLAPPSSRERVQSRLADTGALLAACCVKKEDKNLQYDNHKGGEVSFIECVLPGGAGWTAALQVRVLHAKVRHTLLRRKHRKWDNEKYGVPINQEDMAATLLAFSANALLGCEMILGFPLPEHERRAYMAFWRYIGWLLGVPTVEDVISGNKPLDPCGPGWLSCRPDTTQHSYAVFQSIIFHILNPDKTSVEISHHLLRIGRRRAEQTTKECQSQAPETDKRTNNEDNWFYFRSLQCRRFVGDKLADSLELPLHPIWYKRVMLWMASTLYLLMLRLYTMAALPYSPFRGYLVRFHQRRMQGFFDNVWQPTHLERMQRDLAKTRQKNGSSHQSSVCPFAMVALPTMRA